MVARAQSSDFAIFMRKIGYSVGLEHTVARVADFARLYGQQDTLTIGDIKRLLHSDPPHGWGLKPQNEHILDFFRSIELLTVRGGDVGVLELGEALGVLWKLQEEEQFQITLRLLLTHALVLADGDIFLNALAVQFDEREFAGAISRLVEFKWSTLEQVFQTTQQRAAIYKAVNIEIQENNPGSRGHAGNRVGPLDGGVSARSGPLSMGDVARPDIQISPNYLTKTLGRRRAWATTLGLATEQGALTLLGQRLLDTLSAAGYAGPSCMATWPLTHELAVPLFTATRLPSTIPRLSSWNFMVIIGRGMNCLGDGMRVAGEREMDQLLRVMRAYRSLNLSKSIVRNEVPVRVAYRALLGFSVCQPDLPDYPAMIQQEQSAPSPRVIARTSRIAEIALSEAR